MPTLLWSTLIIGVELLGIATAVHALMTVRSERGTIAWCISLVAMPFVALPLYVIFGRAKFDRYRQAIAEAFEDHLTKSEELAASVKPHEIEGSPLQSVLAKLSPFSFTSDNQLKLLIDGEATFGAIFEEIRKAKDYVFIEFYIIKDDELGTALKELLIERAQEGIRIYLLYDEIGSKDLSDDFLDALRQVGVETASFGPPLRRCDFFHLNFRNHRKIVVVDGEVAFLGGHNVGDEYLGKDASIGDWRDTHVQVTGPAAFDCQRVFLESWYWASKRLPPVNTDCTFPSQACQSEALVLPTGPVRKEEVCTLAYKALINEAQERCWIASPYFAPNETIIDSLRYAALRGVDVRILLPARPDHFVVHLASYSYIDSLSNTPIKFYRYLDGFLHQKVILIDEVLAGVTTMNMDQRSFHLNFEVALFANEQRFVEGVARMLERDFSRSRLASADDYRSQTLPFRVAVNVARLFGPVL